MFSQGKNFKVRDIELREKGRMLVEWAESRMPVMMQLKKKYSEIRPLKGMRIAGCLHVTKETAVLVKTLVAAGAEVSWSGCNPLSTKDEVAALLASENISIYAWHGMNVEEFYWCIDRTLDFKPTLTLDDGADLIFSIHNRHSDLCEYVFGGTEETTTGVHRLRAMAEAKALKYPVIAVNDAETKWDFDNIYGTGQSPRNKHSARGKNFRCRRLRALRKRNSNEGKGNGCACPCDRSCPHTGFESHSRWFHSHADG
jgi:adenosylhomocysteinase